MKLFYEIQDIIYGVPMITYTDYQDLKHLNDNMKLIQDIWAWPAFFIHNNKDHKPRSISYNQLTNFYPSIPPTLSLLSRHRSPELVLAMTSGIWLSTPNNRDWSQLGGLLWPHQFITDRIREWEVILLMQFGTQNSIWFERISLIWSWWNFADATTV